MWWALALFSATTQISRNIIMKQVGHRMDEYIGVWGRFTFLLPFSIILLFFQGVSAVPPLYWAHAVGAGFFVALSTIFLGKAFKYTDISLAVALWKVNVVTLLVLGILFLGETVTLVSVLGVIVAFLGVYLLNIEQAKTSLFAPLLLLGKEKGLRYALMAGVSLAPASVFFKTTATMSDPFFPTFTNYFFASLFTLPFVLRYSLHHMKLLHRNLLPFTLMGLLACLTTISQNAAFRLTNASYVEAVKQVEVLLGLGAGVFFFQEHTRVKQIWPGCVVLVLGILLVILSG